MYFYVYIYFFLFLSSDSCIAVKPYFVFLVLVELYNSQVMLRGMETNGYVIVSAGRASILSSEHQPVWRDRQPRSKTTWIGTLEFMQVCDPEKIIVQMCHFSYFLRFSYFLVISI